jgi:hypothetical protein
LFRVAEFVSKRFRLPAIALRFFDRLTVIAGKTRQHRPSPYTTGFWSRTAIAKAMRTPTSDAARAMAFASSTRGILPR